MAAGTGRAGGDEDGRAGRASAAGSACQECGEPLNARDRFCEACGRPSDLVVAGAARRRPAGAPRRTCADCGAATVDADGYCGGCGLRQPSGRERIELTVSRDGTVSAHPAPGGSAAGISDRGLRRSRNEDALALACLVLPQPVPAPGGQLAARGSMPRDKAPTERFVCAVVCDGVASAPGSEEAAQIAADTGIATLVRRLSLGADPENATRAAVTRSARAVAGLPGSDHNSPACTYVSLVVGQDAVTVGWVGDSRAYWLPKAASEADEPNPPATSNGSDPARLPSLLTLDDSWAVQMVARGELTEDAAFADPRAHLLTGWLGADVASVQPHLTTFEPAGPGLIVACSDGLWNHLPEPAALAATASGEAGGDPLGTARRLVQAALDAGGHDNVTVALIPYPPATGHRSQRTPTEPAREPLS
ncbi:protein phosphatase 2C domain-containing protein [Spirillospora sp. NPDC048911]|uniref:protein phosphatase 2C domain-containing protein n=1 Tax=Spirillospora sp. NPDC048911 TaxID=3364527 RepID=UPI0037118990